MCSLTLDDKFLFKYQKKYEDTTKYTDLCEYEKIMEVASLLAVKGDIKGCNEWVKKRNKCLLYYHKLKTTDFFNAKLICNIDMKPKEKREVFKKIKRQTLESGTNPQIK